MSSLREVFIGFIYKS